MISTAGIIFKNLEKIKSMKLDGFSDVDICEEIKVDILEYQRLKTEFKPLADVYNIKIIDIETKVQANFIEISKMKDEGYSDEDICNKFKFNISEYEALKTKFSTLGKLYGIKVKDPDVKKLTNKEMLLQHIEDIKEMKAHGFKDCEIAKNLNIDQKIYNNLKKQIFELWNIYNPGVPMPVTKKKKKARKPRVWDKEKYPEEKNEIETVNQNDLVVTQSKLRIARYEKEILEKYLDIIHFAKTYNSKMMCTTTQHLEKHKDGDMITLSETRTYKPLSDQIIIFALCNALPDMFKRADREEIIKSLHVTMSKEVKDVYGE